MIEKTDLKSLDNAVWSMALQKFYKGNPQTIEGLKEFVENFKGSNETIDPNLTGALVYKLRTSCGQLEPEILRIDQF